ncbi:hypothetical protein [Mollivirus kamchatka]|nr:hypothetical protein [Mollivirus kamchatka]
MEHRGVAVHIICNVDRSGAMSDDGGGGLPKKFVQSGQWNHTKFVASKGLVLMGAKAALSLTEEEGSDIPHMLVLCADPTRPFADSSKHTAVQSPEQAIEWCADRGHTDLYVLGGSETQYAFLPFADDVQLNVLWHHVRQDDSRPCMAIQAQRTLWNPRGTHLTVSERQTPVKSLNFRLPAAPDGFNQATHKEQGRCDTSL